LTGLSFRRRVTRSSTRTIARVRRERLTYVETDALADIARAVADLEKRALPGMLIEAGCALGGSAIVNAQAKARSRLLTVYDVFGMIPSLSENDGQTFSSVSR
jgi:hypothetical protein